MRDKYRNFAELAESEQDHFRIRVVKKYRMPAIIAPHGGGIEPGTTEIAEAIAGDDYSFYTFVAIQSVQTAWNCRS